MTDLLVELVTRCPNWVENVVRGLEEAITPREFRERRSVTVPPWLTSSTDAVSIQSTTTPAYTTYALQRGGRARRDYFITFREAPENAEPKTIEPPERIDVLDFFLTDTQYFEAIQVTATYTRTDGSEGETTRELTAGFPSRATYVPVSFYFDEPVTRVTLSVDSTVDPPSTRERLFSLYHRETWKDPAEPLLSVPSARAPGGTPIVFISVDTFRYDFLETFEPVTDALGNDAVVPEEPRTQGYATNESHASTFTGVHPATHGFFSELGHGQGFSSGINDELVTLPELLARNQYKCSGCGSKTRIGPITGFGDGMHRYRNYPISYLDRQYDGTDITKTTIEWIRRDAQADSNRLFYFMHFFDPHYPYLPPEPSRTGGGIDLAALDRYSERAGYDRDYLSILHGDRPDVPADDIENFKRNYETSLEFVASQVVEVIDALKRAALFDDALVIVAGDHGEEFLERKFPFHQSLYDANVRPGMIVKPPSDAMFDVPDTVDYVDILPTIARIIGSDVPDQCVGHPMQEATERPRIVERIGRGWYNLAVEVDGTKAIFTYDFDFPEPPTEAQLDDGPVKAEYYRLSDVRDGDFEGHEPSSETKDRLRRLAEEFVRRGERHDHDMSGSVSSDVEDRLENLGYK